MYNYLEAPLRHIRVGAECWSAPHTSFRTICGPSGDALTAQTPWLHQVGRPSLENVYVRSICPKGERFRWFVQQAEAGLVRWAMAAASPDGGPPLEVCSAVDGARGHICLLYTSPSPRDGLLSRMPSSA